MRRGAAVAAALLAAAVAAPAAAAEPATSEEVRRLAGRALAGDGRALERLRRIDRVDGRPVELGRSLSGVSTEELRGRLEALGADEPAAAVAPGAARADAADILAERRFGSSAPPRPLRRFLDWIGDRITPVLDRIGSAADGAPGGPIAFWVAVAVAFTAAVAFLSLRIARRRVADVEAERTTRARVGRERPADLERAADDAEGRGDWELAVRLRFRAGLLRLDEARVLPFRESITSGEVARRLRSREFDALARAFDEVVYGRRAARADDVAAARTGWGRVLAEARPAT